MDVRSRLSLDDVLVVANTRHGPGGHHGRRARPGEPMHDHLADALDAQRFLADHAIAVPPRAPDAATLDALRLIRDHLRALAGDDGVPRPTESAIRAMFEHHPVRIGPDGDLVALGAVGWDGLLADLLPPLVAVRQQRSRLRLCANPLCRFLFLDRSRNASRMWCETAVCGNRVRGQRHRLRRLAG